MKILTCYHHASLLITFITFSSHYWCQHYSYMQITKLLLCDLIALSAGKGWVYGYYLFHHIIRNFFLIFLSSLSCRMTWLWCWKSTQLYTMLCSSSSFSSSFSYAYWKLVWTFIANDVIIFELVFSYACYEWVRHKLYCIVCEWTWPSSTLYTKFVMFFCILMGIVNFLRIAIKHALILFFYNKMEYDIITTFIL